jgi:hypothetical protein
MKKETISALLLALAIVLIIFIAASFYLPVNLYSPYENEETHFEQKESPLYKNKNLTLEDGEYYVYNFSNGYETGNITFLVEKKKTCISITPKEISGARACLGLDGTDEKGSNVSVGNGYIFMFKPWMLALNDTWKWNVAVYTVINKTKMHAFDITYRTVRTDIINGRKTYVVEIKIGDELSSYEWVDAEKRVLVKEMAVGETNIELIEGLT